MRKVQLTQKEVDSFGFSTWVGTITWKQGPRGGTFRSSRTLIQPTEDQALVETVNIIASMKQTADEVDVFEVNSLGEEVIRDENGKPLLSERALDPEVWRAGDFGPVSGR